MGGEEYIENGYDEERGMKYYKLFYNTEKNNLPLRHVHNEAGCLST